MSGPPPCYLAAVEYLQRGWSVIPINPNNRVPYIKWTEFQTRRATIAELQEWWHDYPKAGVGIVTGKISRLVVVDIDSPEQLAKLDEWPETYRVRTAKGVHLYYTIGDEITPTDQGDKRGIHGPGIDSRGEGGYVVAAPTVRGDGHTYVYESESGEPRWRPERCLEPHRQQPQDYFFEDESCDWDPGDGTPLEGGGLAWFEDALRNGVSTPGRNDTCTRMVGVWIAKGVDESTAQILMLDWARKCRPPLSPEETVTTVASVYRTAERKRQAEEVLSAEPVEPTKSVGSGRAPLQLMRFRDFRLAFESQKTEWLVEGWVPKGTILMLVSPPGGWKSFLTAELVTSIVTGKPFMGKTVPTDPGPAILFQQEDPHKMTARRIALAFRTKLILEEDSLWPDCVDDLYVQIDRDMHFGSKAATRRLEEWVAKIRPKLIVFDPLYSMVDGKDHMVGAAVQMKVLKGIRDRYGCSIIIVHHSGKNKFVTLDRERAHGSQFLNAFMEGGFQTAKLAEKQVIVKRHFKAEEDEYALIHWDINTKITPPIYAPRFEELTADQLDERISNHNRKLRGYGEKPEFED